MTDVLSQAEIDAYHANGYGFVENAISAEQLELLRRDFATWEAESAAHTEPYGEIMDGRPRFDMAQTHTAERPQIRRVTSPVEVSDAYLDVMRDNRALDAVAQLIGPNVTFNNAKINAKHPGSGTVVKYHQDFLFEPHTNDDVCTVLIFLDEVTLENGPLNVVPGTHRGPLFDHWHDGVFTGAVSADVEEEYSAKAIPIYGPVGSAALMHTRLLHGSAPNLSDSPRTLYIVEYRAEDSKPLQVNHIPSIYDGDVVRGVETNMIRCSDYEMQYPEVPTGASFFSQQARATAVTGEGA